MKRKWLGLLIAYILIFVTSAIVLLYPRIQQARIVSEPAKPDRSIYITDGNLCYVRLNSWSVGVCGVSENIDTLIIPSHVEYQGKQYTVTRIEDCQIYDQSGETPSKKRIDGNAEYDHPGFHSYTYDYKLPMYYTCLSGSDFSKVILPDTLNYIGEGTFNECNNLKSVVFAKKYRSLVIGRNAFNGKKLKKLNFPYGTVELRDAAAGTTPEVSLPATVKRSENA